MKSKNLIGIAVASAFACAGAAHAGSNHQTGWVSSGDEIYPAMVMFEGQGSQTLAMDSTVSGSTESRASSPSIGSTSAAAGGRLGGSSPSRHVTTRHSSYDIAWVASGEQIYPPVFMSEGSRSNAVVGSSFHAEQPIGSTASSGSGQVGGFFPSHVMTSRHSRFDSPWVASGEEIYPPMVLSEGSRPSELASDSSSFTGPRNELSALEGGPVDRGSEGIYSEYYLVTWSPKTAPIWDSYMMPFEPADSNVLVLVDDTPYIITTYDVILLPGDFVESSASAPMTREEPAA